MSLYQSDPLNKHVLQAVPGLPTYLLGSLARTVAPTRMTITAVASNGATQTYSVIVTEGQLPVAGQLVSVNGCTTNAQFNVVNAVIASVSFTNIPENGVGTFTVTQAGSTYVQTPDVGYALAPQIETGESFSVLSPSGQPFYSQEVALMDNTGPDLPFTIRGECSFPVIPGACTVQLYGADFNGSTANYSLIGTFGVVSGGAVSQFSAVFTNIRLRFILVYVSGIAGAGAAKIVAKVLV
jgi:hypothetical protein